MTTGFSSPYPTSHDTPGIVSYMPSSPPTSRPRQPESSSRSQNTLRIRPQTSAPVSGDESESDDGHASLSDYTFDWNQLAGDEEVLNEPDPALVSNQPNQNDQDADADADTDAASPVNSMPKNVDFNQGNGEAAENDFTEGADILQGQECEQEPESKDEPQQQQEPNPEPEQDEQEQKEERQQPPLDDPQPLADTFSEIEPPLDMSTPVQNGASRGPTAYLRSRDVKVDGNLRVIEELKSELRKRDTIIEANRSKAAEQASLSLQVQQLQAELDQKGTTINEQQNIAKAIQSQLQQKDAALARQCVELSQIDFLRAEIQRLRDMEAMNDTKSALQDARKKLDEANTAEQRAKSDSAATIQRLRTELDEEFLELDRLESDLETTKQDRGAKEEQIQSLSQIVRQLEAHIAELETDLTVSKSGMESRQKKIHDFATDMALTIPPDTSFVDTLSALRSAVFEQRNSAPQLAHVEPKIESLRQRLSSADDAAHSQATILDATRQQLSESKASATLLQGELNRLVSRVEVLTDEQIKLQSQMLRMTEARDDALLTVENLRAEQQRVLNPSSLAPSTPIGNSNASTPRTPRTATVPSASASASASAPDHEALARTHHAQLQSLSSAHTAALSVLRDSHAETVKALQDLLATSRARESKLDAEIATLRAETVDLGRLRADNERLHSDVDQLNSEAARISEEITGANVEIARLARVMEAKEAVAVAMDGRFADLLRRREAEWRGRMAAVKRGRERVGKALLWTWAEQEEEEREGNVRTRSKGGDDNDDSKGENRDRARRWSDGNREDKGKEAKAKSSKGKAKAVIVEPTPTVPTPASFDTEPTATAEEPSMTAAAIAPTSATPAADTLISCLAKAKDPTAGCGHKKKKKARVAAPGEEERVQRVVAGLPFRYRYVAKS